jgi:hypothetical protein
MCPTLKCNNDQCRDGKCEEFRRRVEYAAVAPALCFGVGCPYNGPIASE